MVVTSVELDELELVVVLDELDDPLLLDAGAVTVNVTVFGEYPSRVSSIVYVPAAVGVNTPSLSVEAATELPLASVTLVIFASLGRHHKWQRRLNHQPELLRYLPWL